MATSVAIMIQRTRRYLRDFPEIDTTTASTSSTTTILNVADSSIYSPGQILELEQEVMRVKAIPGGGVTLTVQRGQRGSVAASHASSTTVLQSPRFFAIEILDALNEGLDNCFPRIYKPTSQEFTGLADTTYDYTLPNMPTLNVPIPYLSRVELQNPGETRFGRTRGWHVIRGESPFISFQTPPIGGSTIRLSGFGPFPHLAAITDTLDAAFPINAEFLPSLWAAASLLDSGEAGRVRSDTGVTDNREQANRVGSSSAAASKLQSRFYAQLERQAMPPMPRPIVRTF